MVSKLAVVVTGGIAAAAAAGLGFTVLPGGGGDATAAQAPPTVMASMRDVASELVMTGGQIAYDVIAVPSPAGRVHLVAQLGQPLKQGQPVAQVLDGAARLQPVPAPGDGIVTGLEVQNGQQVGAGGTVATLLWVRAEVTVEPAVVHRLGLRLQQQPAPRVRVAIEGGPDLTCSAPVLEAPAPGAGGASKPLFRCRLPMGPPLFVGASVRIYVAVQEAVAAVAVPVTAVEASGDSPGSGSVVVVDAGTCVRRPVKLGATDGSFVAVEGLTAGEVVVDGPATLAGAGGEDRCSV